MSGAESLNSHVWPDHSYTNSGFPNNVRNDFEGSCSEDSVSSTIYDDHLYVIHGNSENQNGDHEYATSLPVESSCSARIFSTFKSQANTLFNKTEEKKAFVKRRKIVSKHRTETKITTKIDFPSKEAGDSLLKSAFVRPNNLSFASRVIEEYSPQLAVISSTEFISVPNAMLDISNNSIPNCISLRSAIANDIGLNEDIKKLEQNGSKPSSTREVLSPIGNKADVLNEQFRIDFSGETCLREPAMCDSSCKDEGEKQKACDISDHLYSMQIPPAARRFAQCNEQLRDVNATAEVPSGNGGEIPGEGSQIPVDGRAIKGFFKVQMRSLHRMGSPVMFYQQSDLDVSDCAEKSYPSKNSSAFKSHDDVLKGNVDHSEESGLFENGRQRTRTLSEGGDPDMLELQTRNESNLDLRNSKCQIEDLSEAVECPGKIRPKNYGSCKYKGSVYKPIDISANVNPERNTTFGKQISVPVGLKNAEEQISCNKYQYSNSDEHQKQFSVGPIGKTTNSRDVPLLKEITIEDVFAEQYGNSEICFNTFENGITKPCSKVLTRNFGDTTAASEIWASNHKLTASGPKVDSCSDILKRIDSLIHQNKNKLDRNPPQTDSVNPVKEIETVGHKIQDIEELRKESLKRIEFLLKQNESISCTIDTDLVPRSNAKVTLDDKLRLVKESISKAQKSLKSPNAPQLERTKSEAIRRIEKLIFENEKNIQGENVSHSQTEHSNYVDVFADETKNNAGLIRERKRAKSFTIGENSVDSKNRTSDSSDRELTTVECMLVTKKAEKDSIHDHAYLKSSNLHSNPNHNKIPNVPPNKKAKLLKSTSAADNDVKTEKKSSIKRVHKPSKSDIPVKNKVSIREVNICHNSGHNYDLEKQVEFLTEEHNPLLILAEISENESKHRALQNAASEQNTETSYVAKNALNNHRSVAESDSNSRAIIQDHTYEEDKVNTQQFSILRDHSYKKLKKCKKVKESLNGSSDRSVDHTYTPKP